MGHCVYLPYPNTPPQGRPVRVMLTGHSCHIRSAYVGGATASTGGWSRRAGGLVCIEESQENFKISAAVQGQPFICPSSCVQVMGQWPKSLPTRDTCPSQDLPLARRPGLEAGDRRAGCCLGLPHEAWNARDGRPSLT